MDKFSYISNAHPNVVESLYKEFKLNPDSIELEWKKFFEGFDFAVSANAVNGGATLEKIGSEKKSTAESETVSASTDSAQFILSLKIF